MSEKMFNVLNTLFEFRGVLTWLMVFVVGISFLLTHYINGAQFVELVKTTFMALAAMHASERLTNTASQTLQRLKPNVKDNEKGI